MLNPVVERTKNWKKWKVTLVKSDIKLKSTISVVEPF